jgi:hypothetical protein
MTTTMPRRVAEIQHAITTRLDFSTLAHGGEAEVFAYAREIGMRGGELVVQWQREGERRQALSAGPRPAAPPVKTEPPLDDLDEWPDDDSEPGDDDEAEPDTKPCPVCGGRGKDAAGNICGACNGTGRVPADDDEEDDDGNQKESFRYEFEDVEE